MEDSKLREINDIVTSPENRSKNPVSLLMEAGSQVGETVTFNYVDELAMGLLSNVKVFICQVKVGRLIKCRGSGNSKKLAKSSAAEQALELISNKSGGSTTSPGASKGSPSYTPYKNTSPTSSLSPAIRSIQESPSTSVNPIGTLQEMCVKNNWTPPSYDVIHEEGEAHMKTFIYECKVEAWTTQGKGKSKKNAKKLAAENMLSMISEAAKNPSSADVHSNLSPGSPFRKSDKQPKMSPPSGPSPSRSNQSTSPVSFLSSYLYDELELDEPSLNQVSQMTPPPVVDAEVTDEFRKTLEDKGKTSGFAIEYRDLLEKGYSGNYMCFVRLNTKPPTVCSGMGYTKAGAHEKAAKNALEYLNIVCSN